MNNYVCNLCPRNCFSTREAEHGTGFCEMGLLPVIGRAAPHFDEEPVISGSKGSGAIFFSGCNLKCCFCQNYVLSHDNFGKTISVSRLVDIYYELIEKGVHNINLVNPTHFTEAILESLADPLPVPVIWNSGGYDKVETIQRLNGKIQVYLPDLKYISPVHSKRYSTAEDYFSYASAAIREMVRQTGPVQLDENGLITHGTIIRHLILPGCIDESMKILDYIHEEYPDAWISLMAQYLPFGTAFSVDELGRRLTQEEYDQVVDHLLDLGMEDGFIQELSSSDEKYIPLFDLTGV